MQMKEVPGYSAATVSARHGNSAVQNERGQVFWIDEKRLSKDILLLMKSFKLNRLGVCRFPKNPMVVAEDENQKTVCPNIDQEYEMFCGEDQEDECIAAAVHSLSKDLNVHLFITNLSWKPSEQTVVLNKNKATEKLYKKASEKDDPGTRKASTKKKSGGDFLLVNRGEQISSLLYALEDNGVSQMAITSLVHKVASQPNSRVHHLDGEFVALWGAKGSGGVQIPQIKKAPPEAKNLFKKIKEDLKAEQKKKADLSVEISAREKAKIKETFGGIISFVKGRTRTIAFNVEAFTDHIQRISLDDEISAILQKITESNFELFAVNDKKINRLTSEQETVVRFLALTMTRNISVSIIGTHVVMSCLKKAYSEVLKITSFWVLFNKMKERFQFAVEITDDPSASRGLENIFTTSIEVTKESRLRDAIQELIACGLKVDDEHKLIVITGIPGKSILDNTIVESIETVLQTTHKKVKFTGFRYENGNIRAGKAQTTPKIVDSVDRHIETLKITRKLVDARTDLVELYKFRIEEEGQDIIIDGSRAYYFDNGYKSMIATLMKYSGKKVICKDFKANRD